MSDTIDLLDEMPPWCPGCGTENKPMGDGPSNLMPIYCPTQNVIWCLQCNMNYSAWLGNTYADEDSRFKYRPDCLVNIDRIRNNEKPKYGSYTNNPYGFGGPHP